MAAKGDFGTEKQSTDSKDRGGPQSPNAGESGNIDVLVSRFLAELNELSSQLGKSGIPEGHPKTTRVAENGNSYSLFGLQEDFETGPELDLELISEEIEKSIVELETLRPAIAAQKEEPSPDTEIMPSESAEPPVAEGSIDPEGASSVSVLEALGARPSIPNQTPLPDSEMKATQPPAGTGAQKPAIVLSVIETEEKAWKSPELFRNSVARSKTARRRLIAWIVAGVLLIGILGISAFYYFRSGGSTPKAGEMDPGTETKNPKPAPKLIPKTRVQPRASLAFSDPQQTGNAFYRVKGTAREEGVYLLSPKGLDRTQALRGFPEVTPPMSFVPIRAQRIRGIVEVEAGLSEESDIFRVPAISGPDVLAAAAEEAFIKWKFRPACVDGISIPSGKCVAINFNLQNEIS